MVSSFAVGSMGATEAERVDARGQNALGGDEREELRRLEHPNVQLEGLTYHLATESQ